MNTAALQPLQIYVPCILKSHAGYTQRMASGTLNEITGLLCGLVVPPVAAYIIL